jgi:hypothetical protein
MTTKSINVRIESKVYNRSKKYRKAMKAKSVTGYYSYSKYVDDLEQIAKVLEHKI